MVACWYHILLSVHALERKSARALTVRRRGRPSAASGRAAAAPARWRSPGRSRAVAPSRPGCSAGDRGRPGSRPLPPPSCRSLRACAQQWRFEKNWTNGVTIKCPRRWMYDDSCTALHAHTNDSTTVAAVKWLSVFLPWILSIGANRMHMPSLAISIAAMWTLGLSRFSVSHNCNSHGNGAQHAHHSLAMRTAICTSFATCVHWHAQL